MSSTGRGSKKGGTRDFYVTPGWCIQLLAYSIMRLGKHEDGFDRVMDIGAFDGRIGSIVRDHVQKRLKLRSDYERIPLVMVDIKKPRVMFDLELLKYDVYWKGSYLGKCVRERLDLALDARKEKILFVSNPPFSKSLEIITDVVERLEQCKKGSEAWFLLPLNWLGTLKRSDFLHKHSPYRIASLSPRPSFTGDGKTDSSEYCWMQWRQKGTAPPRKFLEVLVGPTKRKR